MIQHRIATTKLFISIDFWIKILNTIHFSNRVLGESLTNVIYFFSQNRTGLIKTWNEWSYKMFIRYFNISTTNKYFAVRCCVQPCRDLSSGAVVCPAVPWFVRRKNRPLRSPPVGVVKIDYGITPGDGPQQSTWVLLYFMEDPLIALYEASLYQQTTDEEEIFYFFLLISYKISVAEVLSTSELSRPIHP